MLNSITIKSPEFSFQFYNRWKCSFLWPATEFIQKLTQYKSALVLKHSPHMPTLTLHTYSFSDANASPILTPRFVSDLTRICQGIICQEVHVNAAVNYVRVQQGQNMLIRKSSWQRIISPHPLSAMFNMTHEVHTGSSRRLQSQHINWRRVALAALVMQIPGPRDKRSSC